MNTCTIFCKNKRNTIPAKQKPY